jgi:hypothetical protein
MSARIILGAKSSWSVVLYLVTSPDNLLDSIIVEVVPVGDLNLGAKGRVDRFDRDLSKCSINI